MGIRNHSLSIMRDLIYLISSLIATVFMLFFLTLYSTSDFIMILWELSFIGTIGLWLAFFIEPQHKKRSFFISFLLLLGIIAFLPFYEEFSITYHFTSWILFNLPVIVALHYIFKTFTQTPKST